MGDRARDAAVIEASDTTGEIRIQVSAAGPPIVTFGPATKSHYEPVECAVALHGMLNEALGTLWAQAFSERAEARRAARAPRDGESGRPLDVDARLARLSGSLDEARLKIESIRAGEAAEETHAAGRADRVWMEERGGFLLQIRIDPAFYATYASEMLAAEATECLAELIDTSRPTRAGSSH